MTAFVSKIDSDYKIKTQYKQQETFSQQLQPQTQIELEEVYDPKKSVFGELQAFVAGVKRDNPNAGPLKVVADMEKIGNDKPILNVVNKRYSGHMVFKVCTAVGTVLDIFKVRQPSTQKADPNASDFDKSASVAQARDEIMLTCHAYETAINGQARDEKIKLLRKNLALGQFGLVRTGSSGKKVKLAVTVREFITTVKKSTIKGKLDEVIKSEKQNTIELPKIIYEKCTANNRIIWEKVDPNKELSLNASIKTWDEYQPRVVLEEDLEIANMLFSKDIVTAIETTGSKSEFFPKLLKHMCNEYKVLFNTLKEVMPRFVDNLGNLTHGYKNYLKRIELLANSNTIFEEGSTEKKIYENQQKLTPMYKILEKAAVELEQIARLETEITGTIKTPSKELVECLQKGKLTIKDYNASKSKKTMKEFIAKERQAIIDRQTNANSDIVETSRLLSEQTTQLFDSVHPYKRDLDIIDETQVSLDEMVGKYQDLLNGHDDSTKTFKLSKEEVTSIQLQLKLINEKITETVKFKTSLEIKPLEKKDLTFKKEQSH